MKCVHPRKAKKLMQDFVNCASDLFCDDEKTEIILVKSDYFSAESVDCVADCEELEIYYNFDQIWDDGAELFRNYWVKKESILNDFSNITLTLLHELGHLETNDQIRKSFTYEKRHLLYSSINFLYDNDEEKNYQYFAMPDETAATEWGINWLKKAENKKIAKEFEKKFLACFQ